MAVGREFNAAVRWRVAALLGRAGAVRDTVAIG